MWISPVDCYTVNSFYSYVFSVDFPPSMLWPLPLNGFVWKCLQVSCTCLVWLELEGFAACNQGRNKNTWWLEGRLRVQELCESRGGRPQGSPAVLTSLMVSVDVKQPWTMHTHWSQFVPNVNRHPRTWSSTLISSSCAKVEVSVLGSLS